MAAAAGGVSDRVKLKSSEGKADAVLVGLGEGDFRDFHGRPLNWRKILGELEKRHQHSTTSEERLYSRMKMLEKKRKPQFFSNESCTLVTGPRLTHYHYRTASCMRVTCVP